MKRTALTALTALLIATAGAGRAAAKDISYRGKVTSIEGDKIRIAVNDGSTGSWTVAKDARIGSGNQRFALTAVHAGDDVAVQVSPDGVVHVLGVIHDKPAAGGKGAVAPGQRNFWCGLKNPKISQYRSWRGEIIQIDAAKQTMKLNCGADPKKNMTIVFKADAGTKLYGLNGNVKDTVAFSTYKTGQIVEAWADNGKTYEIHMSR